MILLCIVLLTLLIGLFYFIKDEEKIGPFPISKNSSFCDGSSYLCAPTIVISGESSEIARLFVTNLEESTKKYVLKIDSHSNNQKTINASCGTLVYDEYSRPIQIESSNSAEIPVAVSKRNVNSVPCSFTTTMWLEDDTGAEVEDSRTPLIIRVE